MRAVYAAREIPDVRFRSTHGENIAIDSMPTAASLGISATTHVAPAATRNSTSPSPSADCDNRAAFRSPRAPSSPSNMHASLESDAGDGSVDALPLLPTAAQYVWELRKMRKLGRGAFGVAWLVEAVSELPQWFPDDVDVGPFENAGIVSRSPSGRHRPQLALKEVELHGSPLDVRVAAMRELQLLEAVRHPNVVRYVDSGYDAASDTVFLLMEFCDGGDLGSLLAAARREGRRGLPAAQAWDVAMQLLCALQALHDVHGVVHRDIKPGNVLLTAGGGVKVADLGAGAAFTRAGQTARRFVGSLSYVAPEVLGSRPYDAKADMWSLGCVLYELIAGRKAFDASTTESSESSGSSDGFVGPMLSRITAGDIPAMPPVDATNALEDALRGMVAELLRVGSHERPTACDLLARTSVAVAVLQHASPVALDAPSASVAGHLGRTLADEFGPLGGFGQCLLDDSSGTRGAANAADTTACSSGTLGFRDAFLETPAHSTLKDAQEDDTVFSNAHRDSSATQASTASGRPSLWLHAPSPSSRRRGTDSVGFDADPRAAAGPLGIACDSPLLMLGRPAMFDDEDEDETD